MADGIYGLRTIASEHYYDATGAGWVVLQVAFTSERVADRPPFWTYYDFSERPTVNLLAARQYTTRAEIIGMIDRETPHLAEERRRERREREMARADTILLAASRGREKLSTWTCPTCGRGERDGATFEARPRGQCDNCFTFERAFVKRDTGDSTINVVEHLAQAIKPTQGNGSR